MMPWESVPRRLAQTSILAHSSACSCFRPTAVNTAATNADKLGLADAERFLGHDVRDYLFLNCTLAADLYQSRICAPFQCSTPSKRFT